MNYIHNIQVGLDITFLKLLVFLPKTHELSTEMR